MRFAKPLGDVAETPSPLWVRPAVYRVPVQSLLYGGDRRYSRRV